MSNYKNIIDMLNTKESGAMTAEVFTDLVNVLTLDISNLTNNMKKEDYQTRLRFTHVCLLWLVKLDYLATVDTKRYDERNRHAVATGNLLYREVKDYIDSMFYEDELKGVKEYQLDCKDSYYKDTKLSYYVSFVQYMSLCHRSLQQSFSELVFSWLVNMETSNTDIYDLINVKLLDLNERKGFTKLISY